MVNSEYNIPLCESTCIHEDVVNRVKKNLPDDEILSEAANFFKVFGDKTRIKILSALLDSEMCVCDIACLLEMSQSAISHQLRVLKSNNLVKNRKEGKVVYYSLEDEHVKAILDQGIVHIRHKNRGE
ncbi:ArsR family transcriptional regulator [Soehngenia longivitae]|uniref:ArsR family transcriptional regulator n=1 Tax=Soehngenia longivitae TaxID=2562294 RepID=A0A4Z0DA25_9FIRM|nr:metalloregulator ArsR/SmtB family transcription factor [Soehngenia longivitae]TFZ41751.1 ArsR family transcriptional regulator [Soehngenia longivitae]